MLLRGWCYQGTSADTLSLSLLLSPCSSQSSYNFSALHKLLCLSSCRFPWIVVRASAVMATAQIRTGDCVTLIIILIAKHFLDPWTILTPLPTDYTWLWMNEWTICILVEYSWTHRLYRLWHVLSLYLVYHCHVVVFCTCGIYCTSVYLREKDTNY